MSSRSKVANKVVDMFTDWMSKDKAAQQEGVKRLGLKPDNTAQDRAKAMGFSDETYYHGTNKDFDSFDINKSGDSFSEYEGAIPRDGIWMTDNPSQADWYADIARKGLYGEKDIGNSAIYPLKVRSNNPYKVPEQDWLDEGESIVDDVANMRKKGYDSTQLNQAEYIHIDDVYPNGASNKQISEYWNNTPVKQGANHVQSYSPANIRSKFAHFNPKMAGIGAGSILSADLMADELDLEFKGLLNEFE